MKILFLLNKDIHAIKALEFLKETLKKHEVKLVLSQQVGNLSNFPLKLLQLKNFEQQGVEDFFNSIKLPILQCKNVNSLESLKIFQSFAPDLAISVRFGQIFKQEFINIPKFGVINLHSGILPKYRGVMASFWSILNGEETLGTTLHYIQNPGIDNGDIINFSKNQINWSKSFVENVNSLYEPGCELIIKALENLENKETIKTIKQNDLGEGSYFSYPKEKDLEKFSKLMNLF